MGGGGVAGEGKALGKGEWLRAYDRVAAIVPRVEALAAGRARLEAINGIQHEFWEARDVLLQCRLLKADESRRRWEAAYMDLLPSGDDGRFRELQNSDREDLQTFVDLLDAENTEFKIEVKEVEGGAEHCQNAADHEHITGDLKAALRQLKQGYEALCSEKDKEISALIADKDKEVSALIVEKNKEVSALIAEKDFVRDKFRSLERGYADLRSYSSKQAAQVTEAKQQLEQLQVASQKKDDEIRILRARAKVVEAKRKLLPEEKLQEMSCMAKETDGQTCKDRQPETGQKSKKVMSETHNKNCSKGPALRREETKHYSSKKMLAKDGHPQASQKRKFVTFLSNDNNEQNANDKVTSNQVLEPLKKKRVPEKGEVEQDDSKAKVVNGKSNGANNRVVTQYRARREPAPEVTPAAGASETASGSAAPEATPRPAGPEVEIPAVQVAEVAAEGRVDISKPTGARDLSDDFDDHPYIQEGKKLLAQCAKLRASRRAYREEAEQALIEKDIAEKRAAELEGELESLRKEREELRVAKEAAAQTRDELVPMLRSMVNDLSSVLGRALPSADSEASDALRGAVEAVKDAVELVKAATGKASGALGALHEAVYPDAEAPRDFEGLAGSFDAEGGFLTDFARDNSVRGLQSALVVLLSHGVPGDFDSMVSSVPAVSPDIVRRARVLARKLQETLEKRKKK